MNLGPIEILILLFLFSPGIVAFVWAIRWVGRRGNPPG